MSTRVLLATLSIPITPERTDIARLLDMDGIIVEKHRRLATLLGLQSPPTRQSLINDMVWNTSAVTAVYFFTFRIYFFDTYALYFFLLFLGSI